MNPSKIKILVVDDNPDIIEILTYNLLKEGFQVSSASNGVEALKKAEQESPHLILLDVMMPQLDGIETCYQLREIAELKHTIISFLSARSEEYTEIAGFEAGADDYIQKPIQPRRLMTRIKALIRRHAQFQENQGDDDIIKVNNIRIDKHKVEVFIDDNLVELPRKEFEILCLLASYPGKVFTRKEIHQQVWGTGVIVGSRTIDVHISKMRDKLGNNNIKTIKGIGYKLNA